MKALVTLTHILAPLLIGWIIGCAIVGNVLSLLGAVALLALDVIVGIALQHAVDLSSYHGARRGTGNGEEQDLLQAMLEQVTKEARAAEYWQACDEYNKKYGGEERMDICVVKNAEKRKALCRELSDVHARLCAEGKQRYVRNFAEDEAVRLLFDVCDQMEHAPVRWLLYRVRTVSADDFDGAVTIVYSFAYELGSIAQNVYLFLVRTVENNIRMLTLESDKPFALCEYTGYSHRYYDRVELKDVVPKIKEVLKDPT